MMKRHSCFMLVAACTALFAGCDNDEEIRCLPSYLIVGADSIVLEYNADRRLVAVRQYDQLVLNKLERTDKFTHDSKGRVKEVTRYFHPYVGDVSVTSTLEIEYGSDFPSRITAHYASGARLATQFTHDEQGRLATATTTTAAAGSGLYRFTGATRYEYDGNGNIPRVYYTILRNQVQTEVLARENIAFDNGVSFYKEIPDLKLYNNYINSYLPNENNCLSSVIYYYSYSQRYTTPLEVTFEPAYYDNGKIHRLLSNPPAQSNFSGDVLFTKVGYNCK